jgi:hypothetical protein
VSGLFGDQNLWNADILGLTFREHLKSAQEVIRFIVVIIILKVLKVRKVKISKGVMICILKSIAVLSKNSKESIS